jgi:hypothetical protein
VNDAVQDKLDEAMKGIRATECTKCNVGGRIYPADPDCKNCLGTDLAPCPESEMT